MAGMSIFNLGHCLHKIKRKREKLIYDNFDENGFGVPFDLAFVQSTLVCCGILSTQSKKVGGWIDQWNDLCFSLRIFWLDVTMNKLFSGPMKSGKSLELLKIADSLQNDFLAFKPKTDTRDINFIKSRNEKFHQMPCRMVSKAESMIIIWESNPVQTVFIDEIQLFDDSILAVIGFMKINDVDIFAAGLDKDFRGEAFKLGSNHNAFDLEIEFDEVQKLLAICETCGKPAAFTQRLENGIPSNYKSELIAIEGAGNYSYESRCSICHVVPGVIK